MHRLIGREVIRSALSLVRWARSERDNESCFFGRSYRRICRINYMGPPDYGGPQRASCRHFKVVGFDCEWVTEQGKRHPVALLQLCTYDGLCGLFRLGHMKTVPTSLKELLEDETIYKVGVAPKDDAKYLLEDYGVFTRSTFDIRHLVQVCGYSTGGLAALAKAHLGIILDKSWTVRCSNWDAEELTKRQINYAAADAHVAIKILVKLINSYNKKGVMSWLTKSKSFEENWNNFQDIVDKFVDSGFKSSQIIHHNGTKHTKQKKSRYPHAIRSKPLYHNCFLAAPDDELLCTIDNKKAQWYIDKGLADMVCEEPLTVKLRFEPASRMVGDVGKYYQLTKENKCVVCGKANIYIRKNVVPREYRKYFPEIMKEHSSHDVVLLCVECHRRSNIADQAVRIQLAVNCGAKISASSVNGRYIENTDLKKLRSAALALLVHSKKYALPEARRHELEAVIFQHFPEVSQITDELLNDISNSQIRYENPEYESYGLKVVKHYLEKEGGLLKLEQLWREHFLKAMKPQHLPALCCLFVLKEYECGLRMGELSVKCLLCTDDQIKIDWEEEVSLNEEQLKQIGVNWS
ncbi:Exonuclease 3'-5' domain-containing protein 2 [Eumeta japonica]|uniref:Exonuclease 3'-5' domain-containing protein 2 n=1 Tax=Eumeta variegata TaxID=151549 RepID=A0A4C1XTB0_EUMVA|nr:Exonuclease 3'-5' domain-containing protein 2 [Eumeta japonica]